MVSFEIQLRGWPLAARKTHIPLVACLLDRCCHGPQQSWSPILIGLLQHPPLGQQAKERLFYIHLTNKKLQVDKLCPLWHTKWVVYMTPVSHFFHVNRTPTLCDVAIGSTTYFCFPASLAAWVATWYSLVQWEINRHGDSDMAFDFLIKGSTCGWCCAFLFSYLRCSHGVCSAAAILYHKEQAWRISKCQPWCHTSTESKPVAAYFQKPHHVRKLEVYLLNPLLVGFSVTWN